MRYYIQIILSLFILTQFNFEFQITTATAETVKATETTVDDVSRWLAGLKPRGSSIPKELFTNKHWAYHAKTLDKLWNDSMASAMKNMDEWISSRLDSQDHRPVFYPFSGPDILNALALFPYSHDYLMIALEDEGKVPPIPQKLDKKTLQSLSILRNYIIGHMERNFFITYEMRGKKKKAALGQHLYTGVTSIVLFFLVRTGHEILSSRMVTLSKEGQVVGKDEPQAKKGNVSGVEIKFRKWKEDQAALNAEPVKRVIFLRANVNDVMIHKEIGLIPLILSYGQYNTILKAASYLMHMKSFDDIRSLILSRSLHIISDDTSIPYRSYKAEEGVWDLKLYGKYSRPNPGSPSFAKYCQMDLKQSLKAEGQGTLPFKFGYYLAKPNLIFATRKTEIEDPKFDQSPRVGIKALPRDTVDQCLNGKKTKKTKKKTK